MDPANYRFTQRRPQACQECTKRKRKCDKQLPCSRCKSLRIECTRETVRLRNTSAKHADEISFLEGLQDDMNASHGIDPSITRKVAERISYLRFGSSGGSVRSASEDTASLQSSRDGILTTTTSATESKDTDASVLTALEYMAWGRSFGGCYPHVDCACHHNRGFHVRTSDSGSRSLERIGASLPSTADARRLVEFHIRHLAWHHDCLHSPTFLQRCETFWQTGSYDHPQWLASYLSVLSSTVYCVQNSYRFSNELGIDLSLLSAAKLFKDMLDVLYTEDFLSDLSLYSVQAIVISTEVAHNLGFSQLNAVIFGAAIRIAQCLGLHKIVSREPSPAHYQEQWTELVDLEVGKRIWCQMVIQDLFAIPFNDSYGINPRHYSTDVPTNCNDDLVPKDPGVLTISSYCRVLARLALLMPELAEGLGPITKRKSLKQQYDHVLKMDQKMRETVRQIPAFLLREDSILQAQIPWLNVARRSLAITAADKIIMIHRPFLFRSFQSPSYAYTRRTCVAAAMTILREHEAIALADELSIWTHTAFCITASVILCFEISYRLRSKDQEGQGGEVEIYRTAVQAARDRLVARKDDVLASRGVTLIDVISLEEAVFSDPPATSPSAPAQSNIIDLPRVVEKFFAANKTDYTGQDSFNSMWGISPSSQGDEGGEFLNGLEGLPDMRDFDEWYNNTFNEGRVDDGGFI